MINVTRLTLSHNKIQGEDIFKLDAIALSNTSIAILQQLIFGTAVPPGLANLVNLEILNLFNNHITELPISLSQMPKLRILNVGSVFFTKRSTRVFIATEIYRVFNFRQNEPVRRASSRLRRVSGPRGVGLDVQQSQRKESTWEFLHDGSVTVVRSIRSNMSFCKNRTLICPFFRDPESALSRRQRFRISAAWNRPIEKSPDCKRILELS